MREGWARVRLAEVTAQAREVEKPVPGRRYNLLGVRWWSAGAFTRETVDGATTKAVALYRVRAGQFIYNRLFAGMGSFAVVPDDLDGSWVSNEFPLFDTDPARLDAHYLSLVFAQPETWAVVADACTGTTGSRMRWHERKFAEFEVDLPPLAEQRRIVDLVAGSAVATAAENTAAAARAAAAGFLDWALAGVESWSTVGAVVSRARAGATPSRAVAAYWGPGVPWLKSGEVDSGAITVTEESITQAGLEAGSAWLMPAGTVVVAMYGQGQTAGTAGFTAAPLASNQAVLGLVAEPERADARFLYHWMRHRKGHLRDRRAGSTQPNLNKAIVLSEPFPVLDPAHQRRLADVLDAFGEVANLAQASAAAAITARDAVASNLISGTMGIPEAYDRLLREEAV